MKDVFGNYVIQKVLDFGPKEHIAALFNEIKGKMLEMTKHNYGCRVVQKFILILDVEGQRNILRELKPSIVECIYDLYGNHVIQKAIEKVPYEEIEFMQKEIELRCKELCMHTYGCRVIQRILENFPEDAKTSIFERIINNYVLELSKDQFGNYVIQLILGMGGRIEDKNSVLRCLLGNARALSIHKYASNVVEKWIEYCSPVDKTLIVQELLGAGESSCEKENTSLYKMMDNKYGNYVVQKALEDASEQDRQNFYSKIKIAKMDQNQVSNYVKHVVNCLDRLSISAPDNNSNV